uniref:Uncharacterized protein n=2 Tax=Ixodes scapularis TaxID=6945 RepID=A0A1S4M1S6_IXOSC
AGLRYAGKKSGRGLPRRRRLVFRRRRNLGCKGFQQTERGVSEGKQTRTLPRPTSGSQPRGHQTNWRDQAEGFRPTANAAGPLADATERRRERHPSMAERRQYDKLAPRRAFIHRALEQIGVGAETGHPFIWAERAAPPRAPNGHRPVASDIGSKGGVGMPNRRSAWKRAGTLGRPRGRRVLPRIPDTPGHPSRPPETSRGAPLSLLVRPLGARRKQSGRTGRLPQCRCAAPKWRYAD